jgi:ABC-type polysaccharide/polyol phosphate export permease
MNVQELPSPQLKLYVLEPGQDLLQGLLKWQLWGRLGWLEIRRRYRRTIIGPFWTSLSLFVFVVVLGVVGSGLLSKQSQEYVPFLVAGMVVWVLLSNILIEGGAVFISGAGLLRQKQFEYSLLVYSLVWRNLIVFFHNMIVYAVIFLFYAPQQITFKIIIFGIPGMVLLLVNAIWMTLLLGILTLRFRDVQQIVQSVVQISMFVTPIFWQPDSLSGIRRILFVGLNPLYHLISIVRDPLLGHTPRLNSYIAVAIITIVGWTVTSIIYRKFRKRVTYWI